MSVQRAGATAVVAVLACSCFFATTLLVRQDAAGGGVLVAHYASRIVEISACFVLAMVASRRAVNERALYATGVVAAGLGLVFEHLLGAAWNGVSAEGLLLGALTGIFTGWSLACGMMLFARVFCAFSPHVAMIAIPLSYAGSHLLFLASLALGNAPSLVF